MSLTPRPRRRGLPRVAVTPRPLLQTRQLIRRDPPIMLRLLRRGQRPLIRRRPNPHAKPPTTNRPTSAQPKTNATPPTVRCPAALRTARHSPDLSSDGISAPQSASPRHDEATPPIPPCPAHRIHAAITSWRSAISARSSWRVSAPRQLVRRHAPYGASGCYRRVYLARSGGPPPTSPV